MQGSPHTISLVGIESPGVTAATPLARRVAAILLGTEENEGTRIKKKSGFRSNPQTDSAFLLK